MKVIKETTLHPDGNDGVDLYPKTSINQVEELSGKLEIYDNFQERIINLETGTLPKPPTPAVESAVIMESNGTVATKSLSDISSGGKLYRHTVCLERTEDTTTYAFFISFVDTKSTAYTFEEMVSKQTSLSYIVGCYYEVAAGTVPSLDFAVPDPALTTSDYFFVFKYGDRASSGTRLNTLTSDKVTEV